MDKAMSVPAKRPDGLSHHNVRRRKRVMKLLEGKAGNPATCVRLLCLGDKNIAEPLEQLELLHREGSRERADLFDRRLRVGNG